MKQVFILFIILVSVLGVFSQDTNWTAANKQSLIDNYVRPVDSYLMLLI